ncbi:MAG: hypothetical protein IPK79_11660 [Vampirovibrionales bacterium]|nr:hypothetical protein [Vampirovibrionales bacterium]
MRFGQETSPAQTPNRRDPQRALLRHAPYAHGSSETLRRAGISDATARLLLSNAYDQARRSLALPNAKPGYAFGASALGELSSQSDVGALQTFIVSDRNLPNRRDNFFCAERAVLKQAENQGIAEDGEFRPARIRAMALVNADFKAPDLLNASPCFYCLEAFQSSQGVMSQDTVLLTLGRDANGDLKTYARTLREFLPMMGRQPPSWTSASLDTLPIVYSDTARQILSRRHSELTDREIRRTLNAAKQSYEDALRYRRSAYHDQTVGAALLIEKPQQGYRLASGSSLHAKNAYFTAAEMDAASQALSPFPLPHWRRRLSTLTQGLKTAAQTFARTPFLRKWPAFLAMFERVQSSLDALAQVLTPPIDSDALKPLKGLALAAYFSHVVEGQPRPESFGALAQLSGNPDILAAVIEPDEKGSPRIQIRGFSDYLPILYLKRHHFESQEQSPIKGTSENNGRSMPDSLQ